jgi:hypothetical protein
MSITPKENYIMMLKGEIPEYVPSYFESSKDTIADELIAPVFAPNGPITTVYGVEYIGTADNNWGALPTPGKVILRDITKWRDVIKNPDLSHRDWEAYYNKELKNKDRANKLLAVHGGDYFLTLVSFMGFEGALISLYEEPEEVKALLEYVSEFYIEVMKNQIKYCKPDCYNLMDDDAALKSPFFSLDMYREFFKPLHKKHCDLALENNIFIERHDCGRCEDFIEDWVEMGIRGWNPAQVVNNLPAIKKKYSGRLSLAGCWDSQGKFSNPAVPIDVLREELEKYVGTFAPGGGFVFMAMIGGKQDNPLVKERMDIIKDYYNTNVRDYYKTH